MSWPTHTPRPSLLHPGPVMLARSGPHLRVGLPPDQRHRQAPAGCHAHWALICAHPPTPHDLVRLLLLLLSSPDRHTRSRTTTRLRWQSLLFAFVTQSSHSSSTEYSNQPTLQQQSSRQSQLHARNPPSLQTLSPSTTCQPDHPRQPPFLRRRIPATPSQCNCLLSSPRRFCPLLRSPTPSTPPRLPPPL